MTSRSLLWVALMLVLAQGCAAVQWWEFSRPTLERPESAARELADAIAAAVTGSGADTRVGPHREGVASASGAEPAAGVAGADPRVRPGFAESRA